MRKFSLHFSWTGFFVLAAVIFLVFFTALTAFHHLESLYLNRVEHNLKSQAGTLHQSLAAWGRNKRNFVHSWARQPETQRHTRIITANNSAPLKKLSQFALNDYLRPVVSDPEIRHFYLLGPERRVLATSHDAHLNKIVSADAANAFFRQSWQGISSVTRPVDALFVHDAGNPVTHPSQSVYVSAPVQAAGGDVLALLVLEVDPAISFFDMFRKSSFSETGEAYAFDRDGQVLTPSTLVSSLLSEPVADNKTVHSRSLQVAPLLARTGGERFAHYVREPYIGADNRLKIGAWVWDEQFRMGVAVQQSAEEGLRLLEAMRWAFNGFAVLISLISLGFMLALGWRSHRKSEEERLSREALVAQLDESHRYNTLEIADREARHRAIIDTAWDAIFTVDENGLVLSANPAASRIFGGQEARFPGILLEDFIRLHEASRFDADALNSASGQTIEATGLHRDQRSFPVAVSVGKTHTSQASFFTVIVRDISPQKSAQVSLVAARQRLEMSQSFAFIGTWEWDVAHDQVEATEMALRLNGHDAERGALSLGIFFSGLNAEDRSGLNLEINRAIVDASPFTTECRITDPQNNEHWLLIQGTPLSDKGRVSRIIGHIQRITENKKSEQALLETREMLRLVLDTIPVGVYWKKMDMRLAGVNKAFCDDIGLMPDQIIGLTEQDIYRDRQQAMLVEHLDRSVIETGKPRHCANARYVMNDGSCRSIEISRLPIKDASGATLGMLGVYSDITERLATQKSLHRHHQLLASIYSTQLRYFAGEAREAIFSALLKELLTLTECRSGFVGQVLYEGDGLPYLRMFSVSDPMWRDVADEYYRQAILEDSDRFDAASVLGKTLLQRQVVQANDFASYPMLRDLLEGRLNQPNFMSVPLLKGEQLVGMIGLADREGGFDSTLSAFLQPMFTTCANLIAAIDNDEAIVATQQQLVRAKNQAEKASMAKTEFLSRVSHELRTPMNAIMGFTQLLSDSVTEPEHQDFLGEISTAGAHLMSLINEVLDLERIEAGRVDLQIEQCALSDILEESCSVMTPLASEKNVTFCCHPDSGRDIFVQADRGRARQILLNLISNGIKYNVPEGEVTVSVQSRDSWAEVQVRDTGVGLTADEMAHLFESFNRLHAEHSQTEGVGMGLVISRHLAELMGGRLDVSSTKGEGSCFTLTLPLAQKMVSAVTPSALPVVPENILMLSERHEVTAACAELSQMCGDVPPEVVTTGYEFLERALQYSYDYLVCPDVLPDMALEELLGYLADAEVLERAELFIRVASTGGLRDRLAFLNEKLAERVFIYHKGMSEKGVVPASCLS